MAEEFFARWTRRGVLAAPALSLGAQPGMKKSVAAIVTMYTDDQRLKSHASVIVGRLLEGYRPNGVFTEPRTRVVSMYTDQTPENDLSRGLAQKHGFQIFPTIKDALTLGGDRLAVDAVCFVGEHGDYPWNERRQKLYPRFELMERIVEVFRRTGQTVPVFCDKHLSYSWLKAKEMYEWSRELGFPLMAGSSIPVTVRFPELEIPYGARIEGAVVLGYGDFDAYGFHTLEALQCMVERRAGGETGIRSVEWLEGEAVWRWRDSAEGRWSLPLLEAALGVTPSAKPGRVEDNVKNPVAFLLEYNDGLRAAAYMLNGHISSWSFAAKLAERPEPVATHFGFPRRDQGRPLAHFDGLVHCIEELFVTGKPCYPVERTLLTTCALSVLFESRAWKRRLDTPELRIAYRAPQQTYFQRA
jgi:hypothetical protein